MPISFISSLYERISAWRLVVISISMSMVSITDSAQAALEVDDSRGPNPFTEVTVKFANNLHTMKCSFCWIPPKAMEVTPFSRVCDLIRPGKSSFMNTSVGYVWSIECDKDITIAHGVYDDAGLSSAYLNSKKLTFEIVGGRHIYAAVDILTRSAREKSPQYIHNSTFVRVLTPNECHSGWEVLGPAWRDAIRVAAYRHNKALCMCGDFNSSSTYTVDVPNNELPVILDEVSCGCDGVPRGNNEYYHYWLPCTYLAADGVQLARTEECHPLYHNNNNDEDRFDFTGVTDTADDAAVVPTSLNTTIFPVKRHTRIHMLHSTIHDDRLTMAHKLWESLVAVFGADHASWVMPRSFYISDRDDYDALLAYSWKIIRQGGRNEDRIFMLKTENEYGSRTDLTIATVDYVARSSSGPANSDPAIFHPLMSDPASSDPENGSSSSLRLATAFLARPYRVKGYKADMRRYILAVCVNKHLRGYLHRDGKMQYSRRVYREPWKVGDLLVEELRGETAAAQNRLLEIVTTGYLSESQYTDKPLSTIEFFAYVKKLGRHDPQLLLDSMSTRLALALHVAMNDGEHNLCETDSGKLTTPNAEPIPPCLVDSIRFMHFGCDFHVDEQLNGFESRLYGCTKGPDFSVLHYRDGKMKRDVAADIVSFMGFEGEFDGSQENAEKYRMDLIYDSENFDPEQALAFLQTLPDERHASFEGGDEL